MSNLTPEYIASIRAELNALLPEGLQADDFWAIETYKDSEGSNGETLRLRVPGAGNTIEGVEAVVDAELRLMQTHPELYLEVRSITTRGE